MHYTSSLSSSFAWQAIVIVWHCTIVTVASKQTLTPEHICSRIANDQLSQLSFQAFSLDPQNGDLLIVQSNHLYRLPQGQADVAEHYIRLDSAVDKFKWLHFMANKSIVPREILDNFDADQLVGQIKWLYKIWLSATNEANSPMEKVTILQVIDSTANSTFHVMAEENNSVQQTNSTNQGEHRVIGSISSLDFQESYVFFFNQTDPSNVIFTNIATNVASYYENLNNLSQIYSADQYRWMENSSRSLIEVKLVRPTDNEVMHEPIFTSLPVGYMDEHSVHLFNLDKGVVIKFAHQDIIKATDRLKIQMITFEKFFNCQKVYSLFEVPAATDVPFLTTNEILFLVVVILSIILVANICLCFYIKRPTIRSTQSHRKSNILKNKPKSKKNANKKPHETSKPKNDDPSKGKAKQTETTTSPTVSGGTKDGKRNVDTGTSSNNLSGKKVQPTTTTTSDTSMHSEKSPKSVVPIPTERTITALSSSSKGTPVPKGKEVSLIDDTTSKALKCPYSRF